MSLSTLILHIIVFQQQRVNFSCMPYGCKKFKLNKWIFETHITSLSLNTNNLCDNFKFTFNLSTFPFIFQAIFIIMLLGWIFVPVYMVSCILCQTTLWSSCCANTHPWKLILREGLLRINIFFRLLEFTQCPNI